MDAITLLTLLKENLALELVEEYSASATEAHRMGNVLIRAIDDTIKAISKE